MSIVNALGYYDLAGKNIDAIISGITEINEYGDHSADILRSYIHLKDEK